ATIHGVTTNRDLLVNVLRHRAFLDGATDTAFFDRHGLDTLAAPLVAGEDEEVAALAAAVAIDAAAPQVLAIPRGWRNVPSQPQRIELTGPGGTHDIRYRNTRTGLQTEPPRDVLVDAVDGEAVTLTVDGVQRRFAVHRYGRDVYIDTAQGSVHLTAVDRFVDPADHIAPGRLLAPVPAAVVRIAAAVGDVVTTGQPILWLEAMKMQHQINAPVDGVVAELPVREG